MAWIQNMGQKAFGQIPKSIQARCRSLWYVLGALSKTPITNADFDKQAGERLGLLAHVVNVVETARIELKNLSTHLDTSIHSRLNTLEFEHLDRVLDQMHEVTAVQFELIAMARVPRPWVPQPHERYRQAHLRTFETYLCDAKREFPRVYSHWKERLEAMEQAFRETKIGNAAHGGDPRSRLFRSLVELHAFGRVLDVGCGVFGRPFYLTSYPHELISGIDPLPSIDAPEFELVRGISEYLPWPDESFSTVISATSLDHCMSLTRSLSEMRRVLRTGGKLLLWIDSFPGSPRYAPDDVGFVPADRFHLFHFDAAWLDQMLGKLFLTVHRIELRGREFNRIMYVLEKPDLSAVSPLGGGAT
jgi:SAM-dependent methyltransferase